MSDSAACHALAACWVFLFGSCSDLCGHLTGGQPQLRTACGARRIWWSRLAWDGRQATRRVRSHSRRVCPHSFHSPDYVGLAGDGATGSAGEPARNMLRASALNSLSAARRAWKRKSPCFSRPRTCVLGVRKRVYVRCSVVRDFAARAPGCGCRRPAFGGSFRVSLVGFACNLQPATCNL